MKFFAVIALALPALVTAKVGAVCSTTIKCGDGECCVVSKGLSTCQKFAGPDQQCTYGLSRDNVYRDHCPCLVGSCFDDNKGGKKCGMSVTLPFSSMIPTVPKFPLPTNL